ncbi:MAG: cysteine desulfurase [candidate division SR1 bacterium]|nr:cysteine desulfurase [candidate division SR1 bacterium]
MYVYLDHAATTPVDPEILQYYTLIAEQTWGNPSSVHRIGQKARSVLEKARMKCASILRVRSREIYFTASATEANNIAIQGLLLKSSKKVTRPHILISALEHNSVSDFTNHPDAEVEIYPVKPSGIADINTILSFVKDDTILISLMLVSNEIGVIQPIKELVEKIQQINVIRVAQKLHEIYIHSDCVQAPLYIDLDLKQLGVDFAVISAHKLYAPKGAAVLYIKNDVKIQKTVYGGGQEKGLRSGTQDISAIASLAYGLDLAQKNVVKSGTEIKKFRDCIIHFVQINIPQACINGDLLNRAANNIHITIPEVDESSLLMALDLKGFGVSAGSSCSSGSNKKSNISKILNSNIEGADIRITLGKNNTSEEVKLFCKTLQELVEELSNSKI